MILHLVPCPTRGVHYNELYGPEDDVARLIDQKILTPRNAQYANKVYQPSNPTISAKYPNGVRFDSQGFPDFSPYAKKQVRIHQAGNYQGDFKAADKLASITENYRKIMNLTWHHHQDRATMQLVPRDLHAAVRHTGGRKVVELIGMLLRFGAEMV